MDKAQEIADLKKKLAIPSMPESAKAKLREKLAVLEASSETKEGQSEDKSQEEIAKIKKQLALSTLPESAKQKLREKLEALEGKETGEPKKKEKPKPKPKPKAEPKKEVKPIPSKVVRKAVKDKPQPKKVQKPKPKEEVEVKVPTNRGRKPIQKVVKAKEEPQKRARKPKVQAPPAPKKERVKKTYVPKAKPSNEEPDCDTLLLQFRARRKKAKESQAKRKTTPVFRKIASDVVDAVEKAIKNVPAKTIKESPKETIKKFGMLKKSAEQFLSAFRTILGKEYARSEADKELSELKSLIDKLVKKYK
jgi:hypothetical protein